MNINLFNDVADCFGISDCIGIFANNDSASYPFKRQSHKMAKHTQTIRRKIADELFECVWPLC